MTPKNQLRHILKQFRWQLRRGAAAQKFGAAALKNAPVVFGNAMPKSGSHLLTQILEGLIGLGPFVDPGFPPVNRAEGNLPLSWDAVYKNLQRMKPGDIRYGYVHSVEPFLSWLAQPHWATFFIYRDPRDMLVSHVFYATEMHAGHGMHQYYTEHLSTMEERLNAAITGVTAPGFELASVRQRYESYLGWLSQPGVCCLKFEDLILNRQNTIARMVDYLAQFGVEWAKPRDEVVSVLMANIAPKKSGTFRKGQPGNWREHFTDHNKAVFNQTAGDLLIRLGYETDSNW